jgi:hypothetical protein
VIAVSPVLASAAGAIAAITVVLYQAWLMPFFQPFFAGREGLARLVFYTLYGSLLLTTTIVFGVRADIRRAVVPLALVAAVCVGAAVLHPIGEVTRAYIIAIGMGGAVVVLMQGSAPGAVLRVSAAVTVLNAALCFVDLLFADGFTTTVGRAAGLAINPNVAAAAVLLGAAASHRAVPRRFHLSFVVLTLGAIAVTLSRSTMLVAAAAIAVPAAVEIWRRARARRPLWIAFDGVRPAVFVAVGLVAWVGAATAINPRFRPVVHAVVSDSLEFADAIGAAHEFVAVAAQDASPPPVAGSGVSSAAVGDGTPEAGARPPASDASRIAALDARLSDEGARNSISARTLFLERAMLEYRHNGFFGIGLEAAHPLVPHNTFVLFALAFGHLGWLIPLALVVLAFRAARDARDLPLSIALAGAMATSHDILLTPSLFLPIAIGIGGMIASGGNDGERQSVHRSVAFGASAAVGLFVLGCLVIVSVVPSSTVERLGPASIIEYRGAYLANVPRQTFPGVFVPAIGAGPEDTATFLRDSAGPLRRVRWNLGLRVPVAPGEFATHDDVVLFAPADGGDPRGGGHTLDLGLPHKVGAPFYALLATLAVWCAGVRLWLMRTNRAGHTAGVLEASS